MQVQRKNFESLRCQLKVNIFQSVIKNSEQTMNIPIKQMETPKFKKQRQSIVFNEKYELEEENELGQGCHSIVKMALLKQPDWDNPQKFAVKICRSGDPEIVNTSIETFKNQMLLDNPFIVKALELYIDENTETHYLVMEHCPYPSMEDLIISKNIKLEEDLIKSIFQSCLKAVAHMHERGIAHRDLKPDNILVQYPPPKIINEYPIKIIDFGVSAKFKILQVSKFFSVKVKDMWTRTGTHFYCAPEIFAGGGYDEKVDIWAMGITLYQLLSGGQLPFQKQTIIDTIESIEKDELNLETKLWENVSVFGKDLIERMLNKNPTQRISASECLLHPWFYKNAMKQKKLIKSSVDIDFSQYQLAEQFFQNNKQNRCNTFKDFFFDKSSKKSLNSSLKSVEQVEKKLFVKSQNKLQVQESFGQKIKSKWDLIELGQPIEDDEDISSPIIQQTKFEAQIKKKMHIKKKQYMQFQFQSLRRRNSMMKSNDSEKDVIEMQRQRRKTMSLINMKESFEQILV